MYTAGMLFCSSMLLLLRARLGIMFAVPLIEPRDRTLARLVREFRLARKALKQTKHAPFM